MIYLLLVRIVLASAFDSGPTLNALSRWSGRDAPTISKDHVSSHSASLSLVYALQERPFTEKYVCFSEGAA